MRQQSFDIPGPWLFRPKRHGDERGYFAETFRQSWLEDGGVICTFIQENESLSAQAGTVRGLHFQKHPTAQAKMITVVRGSILDVMVDVRRSSPHYGQHLQITLNADECDQLFIPIGFAHGFCTLEPDTMIRYRVSSYYSAADEGGILWNDPDLAIKWPVPEADATLSDKDKMLPRFSEFVTPFD